MCQVLNGSEKVSGLKLTVAIPTYRRPGFLARAVASVFAQSRRADEILVISREDDHETNVLIRDLLEKTQTSQFRNTRIRETGFLPPIRTAVAEASGDVLVLLDDDAEAHPDWLARIAEYYCDPKVGGVGGRYINYFSGVAQHYSLARKVGTVSWYGRSIGNMYRDCAFAGPIDVMHLMGGNMSFRLPLFRQCLPDARIGNNVAFHWEMDVALQVTRLGYRILFDPAIKIDHHSAPRICIGLRSVNYDGIYWSNFNYALLMRKHLPPSGLAAYLAYTILVGGAGSPGIVHLVYSALRGHPTAWHDLVLASMRGRLAGLRA